MVEFDKKDWIIIILFGILTAVFIYLGWLYYTGLKLKWAQAGFNLCVEMVRNMSQGV